VPAEAEQPAQALGPAQATPAEKPEVGWVMALISKEWPAIKKFFVHIAFFVAGALAVMFLYEKFIIPGKDATIVQLGATISQKDETVRTISEERDSALRENTNLRSQNALYQSAHDEKSFPLKKRVHILTKQLDEFADGIAQGKIDINQRNSEWNERFMPRINVLQGQLDEQGQHSDEFDKPLDYNLMTFHYPQYITNIAMQFNKLADALPDGEAP